MDAPTVDAIAALSHKAVIHREEGMTPFATCPGTVRVESLEKYLPAPLRVQQESRLLTAEAFAAYWNRFQAVNSVIFADERSATYVAIIDYHGEAGTPQWCDHKAIYTCPQSPEWKIWTGMDGKPMAQPQFAEFIEDNYPDVTKPSHAQMLEIASNLIARKSVDFAQSTRIDNGQSQLTYNEKITGSVETKAGTMKIPDEFEITVPVFIGSTPQKVRARLRYRIQEGKLSMWYQLFRPAKIVEEATQAITAAIKKGVGEAPFFVGSHK